MMECPKCEGTGVVPNDDESACGDTDCCPTAFWCDMCRGDGEIENV